MVEVGAVVSVAPVPVSTVEVVVTGGRVVTVTSGPADTMFSPPATHAAASSDNERRRRRAALRIAASVEMDP